MTIVDFNSGITFHPEAPKRRRTDQPRTEKRFQIFKKPKFIRISDQQNCSLDKKHTSNTFLITIFLWDMEPAALMILHQTVDRDSMSNHYPQKKTHQPRTGLNPLFPSLRAMDSKMKGLPINFAFFQVYFLYIERILLRYLVDKTPKSDKLTIESCIFFAASISQNSSGALNARCNGKSSQFSVPSEQIWCSGLWASIAGWSSTITIKE